MPPDRRNPMYQSEHLGNAIDGDDPEQPGWWAETEGRGAPRCLSAPVRGGRRAARKGGRRVTPPVDAVFLLDVDNTLLDNDRVEEDLRRHIEQAFGAACQERYWQILEQLR
jgi:hypothetical protein